MRVGGNKNITSDHLENFQYIPSEFPSASQLKEDEYIYIYINADIGYLNTTTYC